MDLKFMDGNTKGTQEVGIQTHIEFCKAKSPF